MKKNIRSFLFFLLLVAPPHWSQTPTFRPISEGVEHLQITRGQASDDEATGPFVINLLRVDLGKAEVRVVHALDEAVGLETTSSMAARYGAIAATNAGFFATTGTYRGDAVSVLMVNGNLLSEPVMNRAAMGLIKEAGKTEMIFGHLRFEGLLASARSQHKIDGINRQRGADELIIFTPEFHRTTLTQTDGVELIVRQNRITAIKDRAGSLAIPQDGFVVSANGASRTWVLQNLKVGQRLQQRTKLLALEKALADKWRRVSFIVGGAPQLISGGRLDISNEVEHVNAKFVTDRHPRTAVAKLGDGRLLLVTVDGRQKGYSTGMGLRQLAELLLEIGAVDAINLDGGGSTTMVIDGKLVNKPSDAGGERAVSDAILILGKSK
jgi:exopolysaccharide biosynthesis protein